MSRLDAKTAVLATILNRRRNKGKSAKIGIADVILCAAAGFFPEEIIFGILGTLDGKKLGGTNHEQKK